MIRDIYGWFARVGDGAPISGSEQLISNKLAQKECGVFFNFFFIFLSGANFILLLAQPSFLRNWLEQQNQEYSNKKALNFCATFIRLC